MLTPRALMDSGEFVLISGAQRLDGRIVRFVPCQSVQEIAGCEAGDFVIILDRPEAELLTLVAEASARGCAGVAWLAAECDAVGDELRSLEQISLPVFVVGEPLPVAGLFGGVRRGRTQGGPTIQAVVDLLGSAIRRPVTLESITGDVLAYSDHSGVTDAARTRTLLKRRVPGDLADVLTRRGVYLAARLADEPVMVEPMPEFGQGRRVVHPVRLSAVVFGYLWVLTGGPLSAEDVTAMRQASVSLAIELMRQDRAGHQLKRHRRALLSRLLGGRLRTHDWHVCYHCFGVDYSRLSPFVVAAVILDAPHRQLSEDSADQAVRAVEIRMKLMGVAVLAGMHNGMLVAVLRDEPSGRSLQAGAELVSAMNETLGQKSAAAGLSRVCDDIASAGKAYHDAAWTALVGISRTGYGRLYEPSQLGFDLMISRLHGARGVDLVSDTAISRLQAYDAQSGTDLVATLECFLSSRCDRRETARRLGVHRNTCDYRLRRIEQCAGVDLKDMCQLAGLYVNLRLRTLDRFLRQSGHLEALGPDCAP